MSKQHNALVIRGDEHERIVQLVEFARNTVVTLSDGRIHGTSSCGVGARVARDILYYNITNGHGDIKRVRMWLNGDEWWIQIRDKKHWWTIGDAGDCFYGNVVLRSIM